MDPVIYFTQPETPTQRQYEALKAYFAGSSPTIREVAQQFGFSPLYFKKLKNQFVKDLQEGRNPFFEQKKTGPKQRRTQGEYFHRFDHPISF